MGDEGPLAEGEGPCKTLSFFASSRRPSTCGKPELVTAPDCAEKERTVN